MKNPVLIISFPGITKAADVYKRQAVYRALEDGRTAVMDNDHGSTDPCAVGEPLLAACNYSRSPVLKKGYDKLLLWALDKAPRNKDGVEMCIRDRGITVGSVKG